MAFFLLRIISSDFNKKKWILILKIPSNSMWSQYLIIKIRTHLDNVDSNIFSRDNYKKKLQISLNSKIIVLKYVLYLRRSSYTSLFYFYTEPALNSRAPELHA